MLHDTWFPKSTERLLEMIKNYKIPGLLNLNIQKNNSIENDTL